ncbi:MAG: acyl-CoA dehydrogenase family protein, partial [Elusimicrobiota bacterium]
MAEEQEYQGAQGRNYFAEDKLVRNILQEKLPAARRTETLEKLHAFGELCGGRLAELVESAHRDGRYPVLRQYDRWGKRSDEIDYGPEQVEARRLALEAGLLPPVPLIERMTMAYLLNQNGEGGITCPLAMTDGLVDLLEARGTAEQKKRYLPLLRDPATATPLTAGQFVTEKQGGSNVSENDTQALAQADGTWRLTGVKWFCSNPGELWVTTAKPKGSSHVALFLMPRRLPGGELNDCRILRLKDLSGTRGKATAEVEYQGARAEMIGRPIQGLALLLGTVLKTSRVHVAAASLGYMRRAFFESQLYCDQRVVLGRPIDQLPHVRSTLADMGNVLATSTRAFYLMLDMLERKNPAADILVPLLKIMLSEAG